jgi:predicted nucleic acid-binding protein
VAIRAVIDTNIWVSSLLNPFGFPAKLRKAFQESAFHAIISELMKFINLINPVPFPF